MQRRVLGSSGFEISTIGLGSWAIGGHMWGGQDDAKSVEAIHAAVDHGINWIDTAPIYGSGHSEEVVGRAVKQLPAARRPLIFTKFGLGADSDVREAIGIGRRGPGRVRRQPAPARRRAHRSLSAALAGAAADRGNGGGVRGAAEGRQDPRDRRLELLGRPARRVARDRRTAALGSAALQHPPSRREGRRVAVVRGARRRRDLVLAAVPRAAVRHLVPGQDVSRRRRAQHAQGLRGRAFSAAPAGGRRDPRGRHERRSQRAAAVRRRAACTRRA